MIVQELRIDSSYRVNQLMGDFHKNSLKLDKNGEFCLDKTRLKYVLENDLEKLIIGIPITEDYMDSLNIQKEGAAYVIHMMAITPTANDMGWIVSRIYKGQAAVIKIVHHIHQLQNMFFALYDKEISDLNNLPLAKD